MREVVLFVFEVACVAQQVPEAEEGEVSETKGVGHFADGLPKIPDSFVAYAEEVYMITLDRIWRRWGFRGHTVVDKTIGGDVHLRAMFIHFINRRRDAVETLESQLFTQIR